VAVLKEDRCMQGFSTIDATSAAEPRRLEVLSGAPRRRTHSDAEKARLVAETLRLGVCAADVARRNGLHPQQLYTWRRQARRGELALRAEDAPMFVPAMTAEPLATESAAAEADEIVVELPGGVRLRIGAGVPAERAAALVAALKAPA
jgi:transposase